MLARSGVITNRTRKKLERLDSAFNISRHITVQSVNCFASSLLNELSSGSNTAAQPSITVSYTHLRAHETRRHL
eukprot:2958332-Prorocentrum_lima.AAC.1